MVDLRTKGMLAALAAALAAGLAGAPLAWRLVVERFDHAEAALVQADLERVERALARELDDLRLRAAGWGQWDEAYGFVQDRNPAFRAAHLVPSALALIDVHGLLLVDALGAEAAAVVAPRHHREEALPAALSCPTGPLLAATAAGRRAGALVPSGAHVLLAAASPVTDGAGVHPPRGAVVVARELDGPLVRRLAEQLRVELALEPWEAASALAGEVHQATLRLGGGPGPLVQPRDGDVVAGFASLPGIDGRPALLVRVLRPRDLHRDGVVVAGVVVAGGLVLLLAVAVASALAFGRLALTPARRLAEGIDSLERDPQAALPPAPAGELAQLAAAVARAVGRERSASAALSASQQRYQALFERSADAVLVVEGERVVDANLAAVRLFAEGDRARLLATPYASLLGTEEPADDESSSWSTNGGDWLMRRLDGTTFRALVRGAVVELDGRSTTQLVIEDRGARRRQDQEQAVLALLAEGTSEAIAIATPRGRLVYLNRAGRMLVGMRDDAPLGPEATLAALMPPEAWARTRETAIPQALVDGTWRGEGELLGAEGRRIPILQSAVALTDRRGRRHLIGLVVRDLTRERAQERELRSALDTAVDAARARQDFLSTVSHELRTPLNGVIGMTSLLLSTRLDAEQRDFAETIRLCGENLLTLINDILDLSRFEAGQLELERIPFAPRGLLEEAVQIVAERAAAKGLALASLTEPEVPAWLMGDPTRLRQVLVNLLSNAVKFTERGEVVVELRSGGPGGALELAVRDTGIGIDPAVLPNLFRPFVQADSSTTRRFGGTGLGLAICRRLVELMGGEVTVDSAPGLGSTFTCRLPLTAGDGRLSEGRLPALRATAVLAVHPHGPQRRALALRLAWIGATCHEAAAPEAAHALVGEVSAVIAPWSLVSSGALDALRAAHPGLPLVALVPLLARPEPAAIAAAGVQAVVVEPLRTEQLAQALAAVLAPPPRGSLPGARRRVLVADDDAVNRILAMRVVEAVGHQAVGAASAEEVLAEHAREPADLILMDCQMPGVDGLEATRRLRAAEAPGQHTLVVAVTGHSEESDRQRCRAAGMDAVVVKPYAVPELADLVRRLLDAPPRR
ncbi:MAG: ATP-binding protein [Planctomycetes bacterium]|nr:ATP-binding protein [Planctomycetota bacterium]